DLELDGDEQRDRAVAVWLWGSAVSDQQHGGGERRRHGRDDRVLRGEVNVMAGWLWVGLRWKGGEKRAGVARGCWCVAGSCRCCRGLRLVRWWWNTTTWTLLGMCWR